MSEDESVQKENQNVNVKPLFLLQKRAIRIITFASFMEHSSPIFKSLKIIKFLDLVKFIFLLQL